MTACDRPKEELTLYVYEGELNPEERAAVEQHLQGCAACRAEVDELRSVMNDLDIWAVPEPPSSRWALFEARLETHIAPLRARRLATSGSRWRWAARLAAAVMVGGLTALSLGLYKQNQTQRSEIATLSVRLGDSEFDAGRIASAKRHYDMGGLALTSGPSEDRSRARRQEALPALLECDERLTRLWAQARNSIGQEQEQFLTEICYEFSEHPFADEAFLSLRRILENQPARRVRPLEF
ncbi:MAG: anti-sigma factor family protein, partial [Planctomycetota bacterium]